MAFNGIFSGQNLDNAAAKHCDLLKNGVVITVDSDPAKAGDVIGVRCQSGYEFKDDTGKTGSATSAFLTFYQTNPYVNVELAPIGDKTARYYTLTAADIARHAAALNLATIATKPLNPPMTWVKNPSTGVVGQDIEFQWQDGNPPAQGYSVGVEGKTTFATTTSYTYTPTTDGTHEIIISDGVTVLRQTIVVAVKPVSNITFNNFPTSAVKGIPVRIEWSDGIPAGNGYEVTINKDGQNVIHTYVTTEYYDFTPPNVGDYIVVVTDSDKHIQHGLSAGNSYSFTAGDFNKLAGKATLTIDGKQITGAVVIPAGANLTATADSGKEFYTDGNGASIYFSGLASGIIQNFGFTIGADSKSATLQFPDAVINSFECDVHNSIIIPPLAWINNPTAGQVNTAVQFSWNTGTPKPNGVYTVKVTRLSDSQIVDNADITNKFYDLNQPTAASYKIEVSDSLNTITQTVTLTAVAPTYDYTFTANDYTNLINAGATMTADGVNVIAGTGFNYGAVLIAKAGAGRVFLVNEYGAVLGFNNPKGEVTFTLNSDRTEGTFNFVAPTAADERYLGFFAESKLIDDVNGTNAVYIVERDDMMAVNSQRFVVLYNSNGSKNNVLDYGQYILGLVKLPFAIDSSLILGTDTITLGDLSTGVKAKKVKVDSIPVDLGNIVVSPKYNNLLDFANTTALIHLPYCDAINIDLDYVIGQTVSVKYMVDVYNGRATILISSTAINDVVIMKEVNLGINIPYMNSSNEHAENANIDVGGNNGVTTPYIEILRNEAMLADGMFTIPVLDESILKKAHGFVKVDEVYLVTTKALKSEQDEIISLLRDGVIFR